MKHSKRLCKQFANKTMPLIWSELFVCVSAKRSAYSELQTFQRFVFCSVAFNNNKKTKLKFTTLELCDGSWPSNGKNNNMHHMETHTQSVYKKLCYLWAKKWLNWFPNWNERQSISIFMLGVFIRLKLISKFSKILLDNLDNTMPTWRFNEKKKKKRSQIGFAQQFCLF